MEGNLKTKNIDIEFTGIASGDGDSFCWDVDKKTYERLLGEKPRKGKQSIFNNGLYRIYPDDFYGFDNPKCKIKLSIERLE